MGWVVNIGGAYRRAMKEIGNFVEKMVQKCEGTMITIDSDLLYHLF